MTTTDEPQQAQQERRARMSQAVLPRVPFAAAREIAEAIWSQFAGDATSPLRVAQALKQSPQSSAWRERTGAAIAYGLTSGGYNSQSIGLTDLGLRLVRPTSEGDDLVALKESVLRPSALRTFFTKYDGKSFPRDDIGMNVMVAECGVPREYAAEAFAIAKANGQLAGFFVEIKGSTYIQLDGATSSPHRDSSAAPENEEGDDFDLPPADAIPPLRDRPPAAPKTPTDVQIFIAHGTNTTPLDQLKKILDEFGIKHVTAIDEPHAGRPISQKVADLMRQCTGGIFIFTGDDEFEDAQGTVIRRPRENVIYELGAASLLYDRKIIIFRESDVTFPSDFSDLGYITFDKDNLTAKMMDLFRELREFGLVRIVAG